MTEKVRRDPIKPRKGVKGFQKGNTAAAGHGAVGRTRFITQELISQLNEIAKHTTVKVELYENKHGKICKRRFIETKTKTKIGHIVSKMIKRAMVLGDMAAIKEIFDRVEGKAIQAIEGTGNDDRAIVLKFLPEDEEV